ncbi:MAG: hypothetical protein QM817_28585 [Archangium sp.]
MTRLLALISAVTLGPSPGPNPIAAFALEKPELVRGCVSERIPAGSYLYVRLGDGRWLATLRATATDSRCIESTVFARAPHFHSSRLQRDFEQLSFGTLKESQP